MAEATAEILRALELRLLRCSLSTKSNTTHRHTTTEREEKSLLVLAEDIVILIEKGYYVEALSSDAARMVFKFADSWDFQDSIDCADLFFCEAEKSVEYFFRNGPEPHFSLSQAEDDMNRSCRALLLLCIGVAAFLVFTQYSLTGPADRFPSFPFPYCPSEDNNKAIASGGGWDMWARNQLMSSGCALLGKFPAVQYLVYAKMLLMKTKDLSMEMENSSWDGAKSILWWLSRLLLLQQRILDERSSSLFDLLQVFKGQTLRNFGELEKVRSYWGSKLQAGEASTIVSMAHLEAGIIEHTYGRVELSRQHFQSAEEASGLQLSVTGVLGFRTVHQVKAKAQMVLVANTNMPRTGDICPTESVELQKSELSISEDKMGLHSQETQDASDILRTPKLLNNGMDAGIDGNGSHDSGIATIPLEADQQAVVLARCLLIEKSTPYGEMQRWEMAPYIEAVDAQPISYFMIRCFCDILRIRWESTRSRTKERALMMMDKLVQGIHVASPGAAQRICYSYGVYVPPIPALKKEYGELLVSCGMIGEALKIFEDLELWDNLIHCYCILEKKAAAIELIKARLCEIPNDPRLWCSLGDVTNTESYYEKALEVSNNKSARAKRSLARAAYNRGDYEASKILWESAMALNSLYPDGWFAFGAAALKARDIEKALDAFTRAVQLDPDNGEAWNNIACLHMIKKKSKEAFIAFKEALKFRRNSWQLWENYSQVAFDIGNLGQALQATKMVLDMTSSKRIDADLLERIMLKMEARTTRLSVSPKSDSADAIAANQTHPGNLIEELNYAETNSARLRETDHLMELLGEVLKQIVRSGKGEDIWGLYARWHKIKGDLTMCSEALLKQVRSYQGADLWNNRERFKKFTNASLQLCEVYMEISSSTTSRRELNAAEMHLRNTIKQAVSFSETEEFKNLQACLDEVKKRLQAA